MALLVEGLLLLGQP